MPSLLILDVHLISYDADWQQMRLAAQGRYCDQGVHDFTTASADAPAAPAVFDGVGLRLSRPFSSSSR
ncbi:hypothetical protein [Hymenobacter sp. GOD-10R]|uniref:hypothetical protein n=1 Tax=Hymenobacter sp. GOD-10R TaxID=3093922 RepID=UPI002D76962F|nr:hypothetical protein [Hymenobacter sp. GOD-10R]WRQ28903.1 hypothetical protein SD425_01320 [Hymenobacter sp. GOD-10R]